MYFQCRRDRGMQYISTVAHEIMQECLPIQCVEAVFLGAYLTANMNEVREHISRRPRTFVQFQWGLRWLRLARWTGIH
jgi:hypothetical protein